MVVRNAFLEAQSRWFLWWPVGLGLGISFYFSLSYEPSFPFLLVLLIPGLVAIFITGFFWSHYPVAVLTSLACLSLALGFGAAKVRTDWLATPFLLDPLKDIKLKARLMEVEEQPHRRRLTLGHITFPSEAPALHKVRLTMPLSQPLNARIGDQVSLIASLLPLSDPVSLNGYNFRRAAYFQGIGAVGQVKGKIQVMEKKGTFLWLEATRHQITQTIRQRLGGQQGEVAAALMTGDRSGINPEIRQFFTDAGIAHILAISGLHLTLVAGLIFLVFRRGLALIPYLAENYPIKKWTAAGVIVATFSYLALSGFGIPGQRAFVMITLGMVGILLDRNPLSMRLVATAATVILLIHPESLLSPSFQLSFAAVTGLVAAYENGWGFLRQWALEGGCHRKLAAYGAGMVATSLIATVATAPYTLAIFNRFTLQSLTGNLLAIPLTSLLIMPAATVSALSLPFGGMEAAFQILSFGLKSLIQIAELVSSWPGAAIVVPTPPPYFLGLVTFGGLWICLWKNQGRWLGLIFCALGCLTFLFHDPAQIYVSGDGSVMAYPKDKTLYVSSLKRGQFFTDQWMKELGLNQKQEWPNSHMQIGPVLLAKPYLKITQAICQHKALVTTRYAWKLCKRTHHMPDILIDRHILKRNGTYQLWITSKGIDVRAVRQSLGRRPWNPRRE